MRQTKQAKGAAESQVWAGAKGTADVNEAVKPPGSQYPKVHDEETKTRMPDATDIAHNARAREAEPAAVWMDTSALKPWDRNPRKNDENVARVVESIKRFGFSSPIIARAEDLTIIAGHTRWKAAQALGLDRVPVRLMELDPADAHLLALADNRLNELSPWDTAELQRILGEHSLADVALAGWSGDDLEKMASDLLAGGAEEPAAEVVEDEVPEPPKVAVTKPGDVWLLGDHVLVCGDCRKPEDMRKLLGEERINVAFTSPPYASQREYDESSGFKPIPPDEYVAWFDAVQANVRAALADDGSWFVNIKEHCEDGQRHLYVKDLTIAHVREWGWRLVDELCWIRGGVPGKWPNRFKNAWEPVFHFSADAQVKMRHDNVAHESDDVVEYDIKNPKTHSGFLSTAVGGRKSGLALPSNVLKVHSHAGQVTDAGAVKHSATFPVGLPTFFIKAYSDAGDVVFDPFMGSGTTIIACEQLGRLGRGTEISPLYCDVIVQRWEALTGKKAVLRA